jgi:predicted MFS family arabinose efflux permease
MWVLALSTLVNRMGTVVVFFLPLFLIQTRGWKETSAATALLVYGLGSLVASPFSGWVADRLGHRRTLAWSHGLSATLLLAIPHLHGQAPLLVCIALWSAATQAYWPASMALITDLVPPEKRKQAFVLHRLASNMGISVGPALGGFLASHAFTAIFWMDGLTTYAALAVLLAGVRVPAAGPAPAHPSGAPLRDRRLVLLLLAMLPPMLAFTQIHGIFPLWISRDLGHGTRVLGLLFTLNTLLILLAEAALNHRLAAWTHGRQLAMGAVLIGVGFGSMAFLRSMAVLALPTLVWTFGEMIYLPASTDAVAAMAPPDRRGQYMGLYSLTWTTAMTVGPWLGLVVYAGLGPVHAWVGSGLVALCGALPLYGFVAHRAPSTATEIP